MSTWKLIGIWFLVLVGEMIVVMGAMELWHIPWISIIVLIGMMVYGIPRRYKAIRDRSTHSLGDFYLSEFDDSDIATYRNTKDIFNICRFTP